MKRVETILEAILWNARFATLIAVIASLFGSFALLYLACTDAVAIAELLAKFATTVSVSGHGALRLEIIASIAGLVDGLLFALVLLIFAFGIYELFIGKIDGAANSPIAARLLLITSLDDLKERLAKVIFLILIVRYFEYAVHQNVASSLDLLYLGIGIATIAVATYATTRHA